MEIKIKLVKTRMGGDEVVFEYYSCHVPRIGEKIETPDDYYRVEDVRYIVGGSRQEVEVKVFN
jgi:hypothetical protein